MQRDATQARPGASVGGRGEEGGRGRVLVGPGNGARGDPGVPSRSPSLSRQADRAHIASRNLQTRTNGKNALPRARHSRVRILAGRLYPKARLSRYYAYLL